MNCETVLENRYMVFRDGASIFPEYCPLLNILKYLHISSHFTDSFSLFCFESHVSDAQDFSMILCENMLYVDHGESMFLLQLKRSSFKRSRPHPGACWYVITSGKPASTLLWRGQSIDSWSIANRLGIYDLRNNSKQSSSFACLWWVHNLEALILSLCRCKNCTGVAKFLHMRIGWILIKKHNKSLNMLTHAISQKNPAVLMHLSNQKVLHQFPYCQCAGSTVSVSVSVSKTASKNVSKTWGFQSKLWPEYQQLYVACVDQVRLRYQHHRVHPDTSQPQEDPTNVRMHTTTVSVDNKEGP